MKHRAWMVAAAVGAVLGMAIVATGEDAPAEKVTVRPKYEDGRRLQYRLKLAGATAWAPTVEGVQWGKMETDFTFVLNTKAVRTTGLHKGCCTFDLLGEHLRSVGEGPKGAVGVDATRQGVQVKVEDRWQVTVADRSPLLKDMTMTFGPMGAFRFGTRIGHLAIYVLPHVDHRFWTILTVAPAGPVAPGDKWRHEFQFPVPGAEGKPLDVAAEWRVTGWEEYRGRRVLALTLQAELGLTGSDLRLKNGDLIHVNTGAYRATGKVLWDVAGGVLCSATAEQKVLVKAVTKGPKPSPRALRSECKSSLQLLAAKMVAAGR